MLVRNVILGGVLFVLGATAAVAGAVAFPDWLHEFREYLHLGSAEADHHHDEPKKHDEEDHEHIHLSEGAKKNLNLIVEPLQMREEFVRTLEVPGVIVERPGNCEGLVTAPLAGVITQIHATPHDRVSPGKPLFTMQIVSETLQSAQSGYFKTKRELELTRVQLAQLTDPNISGSIPQSRMIELEQQLQRFMAGLEGYRHELKMWGLTPKQIDKTGHGDFLTEVTILAPEPVPNHATGHALPNQSDAKHSHVGGFFYEMEELKTLVGEAVQSGQVLCRLADHKTLFVEGRIFANEVALVQKAAQNGLSVSAEIGGDTPRVMDKLSLSIFSNKVDPETQTLTFYVVLPNSFDELTHEGKTRQLWHFRPGQRVKLHVPIETLKKVFVVPAAAVVREGPEVFIFKPHGPDFERYAVHVLYQDPRVAVLSFDPLISGRRIAMNGAIQLNWVLKAQRAGGGGGHDHGHEH